MFNSDLELICISKNVSYVDMAKHLGVSPKTVNDWVKGRSSIPKIRLQDVAEYVNFNKDSLKLLPMQQKRKMIEKLLSSYLGQECTIYLEG